MKKRCFKGATKDAYHEYKAREGYQADLVFVGGMSFTFIHSLLPLPSLSFDAVFSTPGPTS